MSEIVVLSKNTGIELMPTSGAFAHGYGLFETISVREGALQFWDLHWSRLMRSAKALGFPLDLTQPVVLKAIQKLADEASIKSGVIKLSWIREGDAYRLFVYTRPRGPSAPSAKVKVMVDYPINPRSLLAGHKTHNYMEAIYLYSQAREQGYAEYLRMNTDGFLVEGCVSNLFFVKAGRLQTPSDVCGLLPGVIRSALLEVSEVDTGRYEPAILEGCDAVFLTNSSWGISPVSSVELDGQAFHFDSDSHPVVEALNEKLARLRQAKAVNLDV